MNQLFLDDDPAACLESAVLSGCSYGGCANSEGLDDAVAGHGGDIGNGGLPFDCLVGGILGKDCGNECMRLAFS